eukprot:6535242-Prymnesium_polylepis.1
MAVASVFNSSASAAELSVADWNRAHISQHKVPKRIFTYLGKWSARRMPQLLASTISSMRLQNPGWTVSLLDDENVDALGIERLPTGAAPELASD